MKEGDVIEVEIGNIGRSGVNRVTALSNAMA